MNGAVALVYYMLLNKGRINPRDKNVVETRMTISIPITITEDCANDSIQTILEVAADNAGVDRSLVKANITNFDFCHFRHIYGGIKKVKDSKIKRMPCKTTTFGSTFWRAK